LKKGRSHARDLGKTSGRELGEFSHLTPTKKSSQQTKTRRWKREEREKINALKWKEDKVNEP